MEGWYSERWYKATKLPSGHHEHRPSLFYTLCVKEVKDIHEDKWERLRNSRRQSERKNTVGKRIERHEIKLTIPSLLYVADLKHAFTLMTFSTSVTSASILPCSVAPYSMATRWLICKTIQWCSAFFVCVEPFSPYMVTVNYLWSTDNGGRKPQNICVCMCTLYEVRKHDFSISFWGKLNLQGQHKAANMVSVTVCA